MKTAQRTSAYARKPVLRSVSQDVGVLPPKNAVKGIDHRITRKRTQGISSAISQATQNVGLTLYEMLSMAELMRAAYEKGELATVQNRLSLLMTEAENLASSIAAVLELTKLEAEQEDFACEQFDIVALLHDVAEAARSIVGNKPVTVMDASCPSPVVIHSDPSRIRQIITGLMNNAVKFTDRGRIALILSKEDDRIRLTVADTGRGMTPEQINAVLEPFDHGYDGELNGLTTSGLGLRIVKALVKKFDGSISMVSKPGEGSIVEVSLPLKS